MQGATLSMKDRPLSAYSFPSTPPFRAETVPPGNAYTCLCMRDPLEGRPPKRSSKHSGPVARAAARGNSGAELRVIATAVPYLAVRVEQWLLPGDTFTEPSCPRALPSTLVP